MQRSASPAVGRYLLVLFLGQQQRAGARQAVVPGVAAGADQNPPISQPEGGQRQQCYQKPAQALQQVEGAAIQMGVHHLQAPGSHAQGLAAVNPEPGIEQKGSPQQKWKQGEAQIGGVVDLVHAANGRVQKADQQPDGHQNQQ